MANFRLRAERASLASRLLPNWLARQSGLKRSDFAHLIDSIRAGPAKRAENRNNACALGLASRITVNKMAEKSNIQKTTSFKSKAENVKKIDHVFSFDVINSPLKILPPRFSPSLHSLCNRLRNLSPGSRASRIHVISRR